MTSHASNKRPAASEAAPVDLTASDDPSDHHEPERLRPTKDVANPYKKSKKLSTTTVPASSAQASTPASTPAASVGRPSVVADLTLPETGSDEEPPEMLEPEAVPETQKKKPNEKKPAAASASASASEKKRESRKTAGNSKSADGEIPGPIRPRKVPPLRSNPFDRTGPRWSTYEGKLLVRTAPPVSKPKPTDPPTKVAAFDMDGTILLTLGVRHASNFGDLQLWSSTVLEKIRSLHDEGYRLVLITNQGGIQTQLDGKKATFIRSVIDWLAHEVDRPFNAVASCSKTNGFHKPLAGMWSIAEQKFNGGAEFDLSQSFYVGDSIPGDSQGGVDMAFAANVGEMRNGTLKFYTPEAFWGCPSDYERRCDAKAAKVDAETYEAPPRLALCTRAALCGGYLCTKRPILLQLMGVQGSGKSTFCQELLRAASNNETGQIWVHLSQDTINGGKPGKREIVEKTALERLRAGNCVIIDRMHLSPEQRAYFVNIAREADASCHLLWFDVPKTVVENRVRSRTNHVGGVEGDAGARMAVQSISQVVAPIYAEGFDLISRIRTEQEVKTIALSYGKLSASSTSTASRDSDNIMPSSFMLKVFCGEEKNKVKIVLPAVSLGTMNMGKHNAANLVTNALRAGFRAVDTAPTYKNEEEVGKGIKDSTPKPFVTVKVPKSAISAEQVRAEVTASLKRLGIKKADLIILHWPCDLIENKTLGSAWNELELIVSEGLASALGVSNFSVGALRVLLPLCRTCFPAVNQVERHPLLSQWDLVDYCQTHGIVLQAHTALGQGKAALLQHPTIMSVAQDFDLSVPDMLLRWNRSQGIALVTKSSSYERQKAAASEMRALPPEVLKRLDVIGRETKPCRFIDPPFMYRPGAPWAWGNKM